MNAPGDEEEDTGPSVDSTDPEERIAARRLRIQRRIEAAKRCKFVICTCSLMCQCIGTSL